MRFLQHTQVQSSQRYVVNDQYLLNALFHSSEQTMNDVVVISFEYTVLFHSSVLVVDVTVTSLEYHFDLSVPISSKRSYSEEGMDSGVSQS